MTLGEFRRTYRRIVLCGSLEEEGCCLCAWCSIISVSIHFAENLSERWTGSHWMCSVVFIVLSDCTVKDADEL
jgi:hypothetical protein